MLTVVCSESSMMWNICNGDKTLKALQNNEAS